MSLHGTQQNNDSICTHHCQGPAFDEDTGEHMYRRPEVFGDAECIWRDMKCGGPEREVAQINIPDGYRRSYQVARGSRGWALSRPSGGACTASCRLKRSRALNSVTPRGPEEVELDCTQSVMVMKPMALRKASRNQLSRFETMLRRLHRDANLSAQKKVPSGHGERDTTNLDRLQRRRVARVVPFHEE